MAKAKKPPSAAATKKTARRTTRRPTAAVGDSSLRTSPLVPVVGIGASAGGLDALRRLFQVLRNDTGMAFVVTTHLGHGQKSVLGELLSRITSMPVKEILGSIPIEANHVYVRPPDQRITISDGSLVARYDDSQQLPPAVIDTFLRSLAEHRKNQAVGVILSGSGADGKDGLAAIKDEGGVTFAQDQESATVPEMPRAAAPIADYILPPENIASELARLAAHPYVANSVQLDRAAADAEGLAPIFALIRAATNLEFSNYKLATIQRRVHRRMVLHKIETHPAYLRKLQSDPNELDALHADLLINVTQFFRDPEVFQFFKNRIVPNILARHASDAPVRIWVPACASGEEAYSIAICFLECIAERGRSESIQVFGTDVSAASIVKAREGLYPGAIKEDVSPERLDRYFVQVDGGYRIARFVRDCCVFAIQDVTADPPFSKMDVVSCRNLLIYFKSDIQQKVLATFHYALNSSGILLLGTAETVGSLSTDLFRLCDRAHRVYEKLNTKKSSGFYFRTRSEPRRASREVRPAVPLATHHIDDWDREADRLLMAHFVPPSVVIGPTLEILQFRGSTGLYLEPAPGPASLNLLKMCREGLSLDLRAAIHQCRKTNAPVVREGIQIRHKDGARLVDIEVIPLRRSTETPHELVVFRESTPFPDTTPEADSASEHPAKGTRTPPKTEREITALRRELRTTQEDLRSIIHELESNNEELQSANEEILSSNEELQSTNEELETAKEELQATNEELTTVNDEIRTRNTELKVINDDLVNTLESIDVGLMMLSADLSIRRFNPKAQAVLGLIRTDVGRPLAHIKTRLALANPEILVQQAVDSRMPVEVEVQDVNGRWYLFRTRPYRTLDNKWEGAVLIVIDVHDLKITQERLRASEHYWQELVEQAPDFIVATEPLGKILYINRTVASLAKEAVINDSIYGYLEASERSTFRRVLKKVASIGEEGRVETGSERKRPSATTKVTRIGPIKSGAKVVALTIRTERGSAINT